MKKCSTDLNQLIRPTVSFDEWSWELDNLNPAKEAVAVKYNLSTTAVITLYDLTGTAVAALLPIAIGIARKIKRVLMRL